MARVEPIYVFFRGIIFGNININEKLLKELLKNDERIFFVLKNCMSAWFFTNGEIEQQKWQMIVKYFFV